LELLVFRAIPRDKKEKQEFYNKAWELYMNEGEEGMEALFPAWIKYFNRASKYVFRALPTDPRCLMCESPFKGVGGKAMQIMGRNRSSYHPSLCNSCAGFGNKVPGGAEVDVTMLFADIRGSTTIAENISATEFKDLIDRFFQESVDVLLKEYAFIDKLIGDEVSAFFVPGLGGGDHIQRAVRSAEKLFAITGHSPYSDPWAPVGVGVHTGMAYVGVVGNVDTIAEITVLGDVANTASRLASVAKAGEIVMSEAVWEKAGLDFNSVRKQEFSLKGRKETMDTRVIQAGR
jgi:adenylate cyclase